MPISYLPKIILKYLKQLPLFRHLNSQRTCNYRYSILSFWQACDKGNNPLCRFLNRHITVIDEQRNLTLIFPKPLIIFNMWSDSLIGIKSPLFRSGTKTLFNLLIGGTQHNKVCRFNIIGYRMFANIILRIQTANKHQILSVSTAYVLLKRNRDNHHLYKLGLGSYIFNSYILCFTMPPKKYK